MLKSSFYLLFILVLSGCVPKTVTISPAIDGIVVDKATNEKLKDVTVGSTKTDKNGFYTIDSKTKLGVKTTMGGVFYISTNEIKVHKDGYIDQSIICETLNSNPICHIDIALEPNDYQSLHNICIDEKDINNLKTYNNKTLDKIIKRYKDNGKTLIFKTEVEPHRYSDDYRFSLSISNSKKFQKYLLNRYQIKSKFPFDLDENKLKNTSNIISIKKHDFACKPKQIQIIFK
jgi:hypothetical protein